MTGGKPRWWVRWRESPTYVKTLVALVIGVALGGGLPELMRPVAWLVVVLIRAVILLVPVLILVALAPAVGTLAKHSRAGRLAAAVTGWYLATSLAAGLLGVVAASLVFSV